MEKVNLDTLVDDIFFDVRIRSCLRRYYVKTLRQLVAISCVGILKMRELDKKSRTVIEVWLEARGLHLEMTKEEIAEYEGVPAETKEEGEVTFSDTKEDLFPDSNDFPESFVSEEMRCEIYRFAVNLLLERVKRDGNYPCYKDIECAVTEAAEVYEVVNKKLGKLKI